METKREGLNLKILIQFQNKRIPVYFSNASSKKALNILLEALEKKIENGKAAMKKCLASLISIEIVGSEAILHSLSENDTLTLSLY
jgi:hypothetical protein